MFGNDFDWDEIFKSLDRVSVPDATDEENLEKLSDEDLELDADFELGEDLRTSEEIQRELLNIDRINVYDIESYELKEILASLSNEDKIKLFDRIVERIKSTPEDGYGNNQLILSLPPEIRIRYVDYYDFTQWDSVNDFIAGMVNENDIFTVAATGLNAIGENETYSVLKMFSAVPSSRKIEFLDLIATKESELKKEIIDSSDVADYLKQFEINQRFDIIQNVIFKKFQTKYEENYQHNEPNVRFDPWRYSDILSALDDEVGVDLLQSEKFKVLKYLVEESKKIKNTELDQIVGIPNPERIVKVLYDQGINPNQVIEYLINSGSVENKFGLEGIAEELPEEARRDVVNFMISLDNEDRQMSQYEFFGSLDSLPLNDAKELFVKYCLIEKRFDFVDVITRMQNEDRRPAFDYLNILFENISPEELESSFEKIKVAFSEITTYPKYNEKYNLIISTFSRKYNLDENKILPFVQKFGYNFLKYLSNENIQKFIEMDSQNLDKLFSLFNDDTIIINKSVSNDILNSLLQRQFMLEEHKTYNIFSAFENLVQNNDLEGIKKLLDDISKEFDFNQILQKNNTSMNDLYGQIINGNLDLLHTITNSYIAYKRELFIKDKMPTIGDLLLMEKVITRDSYKHEIIKNDPFSIAQNCKRLTGVIFTEDQKHLIDDGDLMWELIQFKQNPKEYNLDNKYKRYLKTMNELLDTMYDNRVNFGNYKADYPHCQHLKFELVQGDISSDFLVGILLESNYDGIMNLLSNEVNYASVKTYLERYKMVGWQDTFSKLMAKGDLQFDEGTIASLLSNYDKIKPHIDNKSSLTSVIDYANCYSTVSSFYRLLFGAEDYNLIAANAGKNKASMSKYDRLTGCRDLVPLMYAKEQFSVPTLDENFALSNGKDIEIVLGNATNMINLTYGERTKACMRKGGAFNKLFEHCATDKNGFHIRFVNPENGNFVSRVSGTRNGNTIFLNELRDSLDSDYNNEDLYEAIKMLSEHLIQLSRDSEMPIDNIVVTSDYALESHKDENQSLNLTPEERKSALRGISFNFTDSGILLASSDDEGKIMSYKFSEEVPSYDSVRDKTKVYYGPSAVSRIIQIRMINDMINGVSPEDINTEYNDELPDYIISGEDYYITYSKGHINTFVMDSRKDNPRTIAEISGILKNNTDVMGVTVPKGVSR